MSFSFNFVEEEEEEAVVPKLPTAAAANDMASAGVTSDPEGSMMPMTITNSKRKNPLDILSYHVLLHVLSFLDCKSLAKAYSTYSTLCVLSRMLMTRIPDWKTTNWTAKNKKSKIEGPLQERLTLAYQNMSSFFNVGFLFVANDGFEEAAAQSVAASLPPKAVVIGGVVGALASVGNMGNDGVLETDYERSTKASFTLSVSNMPNTSRVAFQISPEQLSDPETALDLVPTCNEGWKVIVLLVDESSANGLEKFIAALQQKYKKCQIVGGIMGGNMDDGKCPLVVMQNRTATLYSEGIVGIAIGGATVFSSQVSRACKPMSDIAKIASGENMLLHSVTIDGVEKSAMDFIQEGFNLAASAPFLGISRDLSEGFALCNVRGALEDGTIVLMNTDEFEKGHFVQVLSLDPESSKEDLKLRLEAAKRACASQSKQVLGGLLFTCSGRGKRFYKVADVESNLFRDAMPDVGMSGFFAGGEIGPEAMAMLPPDSEFRRGAAVQGFTAVYGVFFTPLYTVPDGELIETALINRSFLF
jgi:small ligand-binding sensory domain FIST